MTELQYRCFADRSAGRLVNEGHLTFDDRRQFIIDVCGADNQRLDGNGCRAFALAARLNGRRGLQPVMLRSYPPPKGAEEGEALECGALWQAVEATSAVASAQPRARITSRWGTAHV